LRRSIRTANLLTPALAGQVCAALCYAHKSIRNKNQRPVTMADEPARAPFAIEGYAVGDEGKPDHFVASTTREEAAKQAFALRVGDAAFIKRSDLKWTYALVTERNVDGAVTLRFEVDAAKNRKSFPENQWGKYIRVISVKEPEPVAPTQEATDDAASVQASVKSAQASVKSAKASVKAAKGAVASDGSVRSSKSAKSAKSAKSSVKGAIKSLVGKRSKDEKIEEVEEEAASVAKEKKEEPSKEEEPTKTEEAAAEEPSKEEEPTKTEEAAATMEELAKAGEVAKEEPAKAEVKTAEVEPAVDAKTDEKAQVEEAPKEEKKEEEEPEAEAKVEEKQSSGWFSSWFGSSKPAEAPKPAPKVDQPAAPKAVDPTPEDPRPKAGIEALCASPRAADSPNPETAEAPETALTTPAKDAPIKLKVQPNPATEDEARDEMSTKENYPEASDQLTRPNTFFPVSSPTTSGSFTMKRNPSKILKFKFGNKSKGDTTPRSPSGGLTIRSPSNPVSPKFFGATAMPITPTNGKEWFDPEASECDYDKNPTDLFQALEAREFEYAFEMYEQTNEQFTKDCKTWVIAKGIQKGQQLRFRALPLHAAIVFDAPDELLIKIIRAYPKATRGRDVKGRLPIHLAFEHQTSEQVISLIIDAFPKGFFALDKKQMSPLDHINGNTTRSYMAKYIPQIVAAKIEEEREKWNVEANMLLEHQKETLQNDEEFMADVIQHVQEEVEAHNMSKIELLEANYKKEIELLKKKHDSETQALLEGFEVKLNFERKLNKLKTKTVKQ
jgi:hypothetical protein